MARVLGVDIPDRKQVWVALTYIHGVGDTTSRKVLEQVGIDPASKTKDLTDEQIGTLAKAIEAFGPVEGQLRRHVGQSIQRLKDITCYRGLRHRRGLPVRGQNTQSNARSRKGPRKTVAGKKSVKAMR